MSTAGWIWDLAPYPALWGVIDTVTFGDSGQFSSAIFRSPAGQLDWLRRHRVGYVVLGQGRVELGGALRLLTQRHRVGAVRVGAGGALNTALLRPGLADQVSIVIAPYLAASTTAGPVRLIADPGCPDAVALELAAAERLRQGTCGCGTRCEMGQPRTYSA